MSGGGMHPSGASGSSFGPSPGAGDSDTNAIERLVESVENASLGGNPGDLDVLAGGEYAWEGGYEQSWQTVQLGQDGELLLHRDQKARLQWLRERKEFEDDTKVVDGRLIRRSLIRNTVIVLDFTKDSSVSDYRPTRAAAFTKTVMKLLTTTAAEAPLLGLGLIVIADRNAHVALPPTYNLEALARSLEGLFDTKTGGLKPGGSMSLRAGIEAARDLLLSVPEAGTREILLCMSSIQSVDLTPVEDLVPELQSHHVRVSVVTVCPEMYAIKELCSGTGGKCLVAMNPKHLEECLKAALETPAWSPDLAAQSLPVALCAPHTSASILLCSCHQRAVSTVISCPRCTATYCTSLARCVVCDLVLLNAADLFKMALPYRWLPQFSPEVIEIGESGQPFHEENAMTDEPGLPVRTKAQGCAGCDTVHDDIGTVNAALGHEYFLYRCEECDERFCKDCHDFMTVSLLRCYGCLIRYHHKYTPADASISRDEQASSSNSKITLPS